MQDQLDEIAWDWRNRHADLTEENVKNFIAGLEPEEARAFEESVGSGELTFTVAFNIHYKRSVACARRHGYDLADDIVFTHNPVALVDYAIGEEAGMELARKYNFSPEYSEPSNMWDIMGTRRLDDDTVIALVGDDRGWSNQWRYYIAVAWAPVDLVEEWSGPAGAAGSHADFISGLV